MQSYGNTVFREGSLVEFVRWLFMMSDDDLIVCTVKAYALVFNFIAFFVRGIHK